PTKAKKKTTNAPKTPRTRILRTSLGKQVTNKKFFQKINGVYKNKRKIIKKLFIVFFKTKALFFYKDNKILNF
ncbi:hypothetical protein ACQWHS_24900, partial [Salmonella enterica subsp. enterica serovar Infantis]